eukprot:15485066-Alexandrium_andersonii.AAC.1
MNAGAPTKPRDGRLAGGEGRIADTEAHWGFLGATSGWALYCGWERSDRATWGAASWHPKLLRKSIFAQRTAP